MNIIRDSLKIIIVSLLVISLATIAYAWTEPSSNPPSGNVSTPISTSLTTQYKSGAFGVTQPGGYAQTLLQQWGLYSPGTMYVEPGPGSNLYLTDQWSQTGMLNIQFGKTIFESGNVGIGTTDPGAYRLNVNGNAAVNDIYITSVGKWASELYPVNLVNGIHTNIQCSAAGGTVVDDGTGNKMCRFATASCPATWTKYNNWSTTSVNSNTYYNETCGTSCGKQLATCSSGSHIWSNKSPESLSCTGAQTGIYTPDNLRVPYSCASVPVPWYPCDLGSECGGDCSGATNTSATATIAEIGCY